MRLPPLPLTIILLAFTAGLPAVEDSGDTELLLEKAIFLEAIRGKPEEALQLYRRIQDGAQKGNPTDHAMARALLGEATCLDATGKDQLAREKFQAIIDRYPLQEEIRDIAHGYIRSRLWDTPASYMPEEMLFYAEMVKPGEELIRLSKAIRSTPFENPIDASRTLATDPEGAAAALEESSKNPAGWISAFLNKSLFRELSKMGGIAIGIPAGGNPAKDFIAVLLPGESDALSGYITSLLSLAQAKRVGFIQDLPLYKMEEEDTFLAAGENVVVMGSSRRMVEDAVKRYSSQSTSLATNPDFLNAWSRKEDALMFFFLDNDFPFSRPENRKAIETLGLAGFGAISIAISTTPSTDRLHATLWARRESPPGTNTWSRLTTAPIDPGIIRPIPPESLGFIAFSARDMKTKLTEISAALGTLSGEQKNSNAGRLRAPLTWLLETEPFNSVLAEVRSVIIGSYPNAALLKLSSSVKELGNLSGLQIYRPLYFAAIEFRESVAGEKILRDALGKYAASLPGASKNLEFRDQRLKAGENSATHHYLEPLLGIRPGYIRIENQFIIAMSPEILKATLRSRYLDDKSRLPLPTPGVSKVLYLRPKPIFSALAMLQKSIPVLTLKNIKAAVISTREEEDGLEVDLVISDLIPALNGFLKDYAAAMEEQKPAGSDN
ncbi:MAG: hypothetical protein CMJ99_02310 [Planctomycetes bacterium]|nr:hypothetical protein [Planctomycetota bacterium]